ncbi:S1/P1nuclease [Cryptosporidium felis]|nr:S1/P1nuclease [Cryptosporidium felis]
MLLFFSIKCIVGIILSVFADRASTFDADGHSAIGMTTISGLQHNFSQKLKRLMNGKDIVDVSGWGERVSKKHPSTLPFHFQSQRKSNHGNNNGTIFIQPTLEIKGNNSYFDLKCISSTHCLVPMIKHLYYRLIGDQSLSRIDYPEGIQLTDSDSVKFLINLMGDLHQPLHFGFVEDNLGRDISGVMNINGTDEKLSLFEIWESGITRKLKVEKPQFWFGGWTHILAIRDIFDKELQLWKEKGINIIDDWAYESYRIMCNEIYFHPLSKQPIGNNFNVDITLEYAWFEIFRNRILVAGARLSIILNEILKQREGKEKPFRTTNSLLLSSDEDISHQISDMNFGDRTTKKHYIEIHFCGKNIKVPLWVKNLFINLMIAISCFLIFALFSLCHIGSSYSILKDNSSATAEQKTKNIQMKGTLAID